MVRRRLKKYIPVQGTDRVIFVSARTLLRGNDFKNWSHFVIVRIEQPLYHTETLAFSKRYMPTFGDNCSIDSLALSDSKGRRVMLGRCTNSANNQIGVYVYLTDIDFVFSCGFCLPSRCFQSFWRLSSFGIIILSSQTSTRVNLIQRMSTSEPRIELDGL